MALHHDTGILGEKLSADFLSNSGFQIIERNWRYKHWEIDVIAKKNNTLHFIEIKTRRSIKFGLPEEAVSRKKLKNLIDAAEEYLIQFPQWKNISFDILSINLSKNNPPQYFLIEDVYL